MFSLVWCSPCLIINYSINIDLKNEFYTITMNICENKYHSSKIYTIRNKIDNDIYIGSTIGDIKKKVL